MPAPQDRSLTWLPIAGAAAIAIVAVIVVVIVGSGKDDRTGLKADENGALLCPASYQQRAVTGVHTVPRAWVPFRPTGVDGTSKLVPDTKPQHVTVCRYPAGGASLGKTVKLPVHGRRVLKSGLAAMAKSFSAAPKSSIASGRCTGPSTTYMVGFRFATGVAWVTLPGTGCQHVTNGAYDSTVDVRDQVAAAFDSGAWR